MTRERTGERLRRQWEELAEPKPDLRRNSVSRTSFEIIDTDVNANPPAIVMTDPKFATNISGMIRNCACFGIDWLILTGQRIEIPTGKKGSRLPRQERMREYRTVHVVQTDFPTMLFKRTDIVPIGVELTPSSVPLPLLRHPANAVYILGPEDGSLTPGMKAICHQIVQIPAKHCLNVATAGAIVLYDRMVNLYRQGLGDLLELDEDRRWS